MFTGLIEEIGNIRDSKYSSKGCVLNIECKDILDDLRIGSSIAVNGACLTVTDIFSDGFEIEISNETLKKTNSDSIKIGEKVNLERALKFGGRLDGHIVTGHIDCFARFVRIEQDGFSKRYYFEIEDGYQKYVAYKGSIAINGVSLTVAEKDETIFSVVIIPSTLANTNLKDLKQSDVVNIETDVLAKYVESLTMSNNNHSNIDEKFLVENGFM